MNGTAYLPFDSFTYYAEDGVTGQRSEVGQDATLAFAVLPMNDPPIPKSFKTYIQAGVTASISLNGSDVDNSLDFKNAYITR